jgi:hypothetical protein
MTVSRQPSNSTLESPTPVAARPSRKPQADIYTFFLVLALLAVLLGILYLYLFMKSYDFKTSGGPSLVMATHRVAPAAFASFSGPRIANTGV